MANGEFEIGSITKTFTALLLANMVERNEVALSDAVSKYLPLRRSNGALDNITLGDLATHAARFPRVPRDLLFHALRNRSDPYAGYDKSRLEGALTRVRRRRGVGRRVSYSNFGYATLGLALANAAERQYEELVVERVCRPLGLTSTRFIGDSQSSGSHGVTGYRRRGKPVPSWDLASFAPAGGLRSSVADMLLYLRAHLNPDESSLTAALRTVQRARVQIRGERLAIGLAWLIQTRNGRQVVWHNGGTGGFSAFVGFDGTADVGLVALANARVAGPLTRAGLRSLEALGA